MSKYLTFNEDMTPDKVSVLQKISQYLKKNNVNFDVYLNEATCGL